MDADGKRLQKSALVQRNVVGQGIAEVGGVDEIPRQRTIYGRCCQEPDVGAQVVAPRLTCRALAAGHSGLDGDPIAGGDVRHTEADGVDDAGCLVAQDQGRLDDEAADPSAFPVVDVRPADAHGPRPDTDLARPWLGYRKLFDAQVVDAVEHCCKVRRRHVPDYNRLPTRIAGAMLAGQGAILTETVLGIDVGTTAVKAMLVASDGHVLAEAESQQEVVVPQPAWAEQHPDTWWESTRDRRGRSHELGCLG